MGNLNEISADNYRRVTITVEDEIANTITTIVYPKVRGLIEVDNTYASEDIESYIDKDNSITNPLINQPKAPKTITISLHPEKMDDGGWMVIYSRELHESD